MDSVKGWGIGFVRDMVKEEENGRNLDLSWLRPGLLVELTLMGVLG